MSSLSMLKIETQFSMACSVAVRCKVSKTIFLDSFVAVSFASSVIILIYEDASDFASSLITSNNCDLASSAERLAIFSSFATCDNLAFSASSLRLLSISNCAVRFSRILSSSASLL